MKRGAIFPRLASSNESDEVRILGWIKNQGANVKKGDALLKVATDKDNVEVEAPEDRTLIQVSANQSGFVTFGAIVAVIEK